MSGRAALTTYEMDEHVDGRNEDDEIAERHDLFRGGQRDDVGENDQLVVGSFDVTSPGELRVVLEAGFDHPSVHERLGAHRHALVQEDRHDVGAQADCHDTHASEMQIGNGEAREQHEREQHQCRCEVSVET
jgi:hypothetical protein